MVSVLPTMVAAIPLATAESFERATEGQTIVFSNDGRVYGTEQYLRDRRVYWQVTPGECLWGEWYASAEGICFLYEGNQSPVCWDISLQDGRMRAEILDDGPPFVLEEVSRSDAPLDCPGPDVGS
ncbi:MAG: hypothetical protein AAFX00_08325 [Pseudomonadota bacterium]